MEWCGMKKKNNINSTLSGHNLYKTPREDAECVFVHLCVRTLSGVRGGTPLTNSLLNPRSAVRVSPLFLSD